jgi:hypothetical protein
MKSINITISTWIVFALLATGSAHASTVRGRLVHANGSPAAGLSVTVYNPQTGRSSPAHTGPDGMYYLYNVRSGSYNLEVWTSPGGKPVVYQITVSEPYADVAQIGVP